MDIDISGIMVAVVTAISPFAIEIIKKDIRRRPGPKEIKDKDYHDRYIKPIYFHYILSILITLAAVYVLKLTPTNVPQHNYLAIIILIAMLEPIFFNRIQNILETKAKPLAKFLKSNKILFFPYIIFSLIFFFNMNWIKFIILLLIITSFFYHISYHVRLSWKKSKKIRITFFNRASKYNVFNYKIKNGKIEVFYKENNVIKLLICNENELKGIHIIYE